MPGLFLTGQPLQTGRGGVIARAERVTDSTASATTQGVLRLDDVPILAGRLYVIYSPNLLMTSTVAGDVPSARFSATTDGSTPTTGSSLIAICNGAAVPASANGVDGSLLRFYMPPSNQTLSVLLFTTRMSGTGNVSLLAGSGANPIAIIVTDLGVDPGDTGVDL